MKKAFLIFFLIVMLVLFLLPIRYSMGEKINSIDISDIVQLKSEAFSFSSFPNNIMPAEVFRIDMHPEKMQGKKTMEAELTPSCIPDGMMGVLLTDGTHIVHAGYDISGDKLLLRFDAESLACMDSTVGLWLVIMHQVW